MTVEQGRYQVRFDWSTAGARAIGADADVILWVDALAGVADWDPDVVVGRDCWVLAVDMRHAFAAARWVVELQHRLGRRIIVAVVAAGEPRHDRVARFAVEDLLAAGAIIDELARLGLDATSPEAAAAEAAYRGLANGLGHLVGASVSAALAEAPSTQSRRPEPELGPESVAVVRRGLG